MASTREDLILGEIAIKAKVLTRAQLDKCLEEQKKLSRWKSLGEFLLENKYVTPSQLQLLVDVQRRNLEMKTYNRRQLRQENLFGRLVVRMGFAKESQVEQALNEQCSNDDAPFDKLGEVMLKMKMISREQLSRVIQFQSKRQIICPRCSQKYNLILYNAGVKIKCYICNTEMRIVS